jgi:hypothetical protein
MDQKNLVSIERCRYNELRPSMSDHRPFSGVPPKRSLIGQARRCCRGLNFAHDATCHIPSIRLPTQRIAPYKADTRTHPLFSQTPYEPTRKIVPTRHNISTTWCALPAPLLTHVPSSCRKQNALFNSALRQSTSIRKDLDQFADSASPSPHLQAQLNASLATFTRTIDDYGKLAKQEPVQTKQEKAFERLKTFRGELEEYRESFKRIKSVNEEVVCVRSSIQGTTG